MKQYPDKKTIVRLLREFINQDPGFEPGNYASEADYQKDLRKTEKDQACANILLELVARTSSLDSIIICNSMDASYSGRLSLVKREGFGRYGRWRVEYCTGQYFPVEFAAAVCASLAQALYVDERNKNPNYTRKLHHGWAKMVLGERNADRWFDF